MKVAWLVPFGDYTRLVFECPGCRHAHGVPIDGPKAWQWNGSLEEPTISPSILVQMEFVGDRPTKICHSFVRGGCIEFLGDCTHRLAGKKVPLEETNAEAG